jgi:hypothetical protein
VPAQTPAPSAAPTGATPFNGAPERGNGEDGEGGETSPGEGDFDDDDMENSLSLAAIEAEVKPKVVETFDNIADAYKRLSTSSSGAMCFPASSLARSATAGRTVATVTPDAARRGWPKNSTALPTSTPAMRSITVTSIAAASVSTGVSTAGTPNVA